MTETDYRFPPKNEKSELIGEIAKIFIASGMKSTPVPVIPNEFAKMLFTPNPDVCRLENLAAERWRRECIERAEQESEFEKLLTIRMRQYVWNRMLQDIGSSAVLFGMNLGNTKNNFRYGRGNSS